MGEGDFPTRQRGFGAAELNRPAPAARRHAAQRGPGTGGLTAYLWRVSLRSFLSLRRSGSSLVNWRLLDWASCHRRGSTKWRHGAFRWQHIAALSSKLGTRMRRLCRRHLANSLSLTCGHERGPELLRATAGGLVRTTSSSCRRRSASRLLAEALTVLKCFRRLLKLQ
jgi:hypothetical protein